MEAHIPRQPAPPTPLHTLVGHDPPQPSPRIHTNYVTRKVSDFMKIHSIRDDIDAGDCDGLNDSKIPRARVQGWHVTSQYVVLASFSSRDEFESYLDEISPYMSRLLAILKHTTLDLEILCTPRGDQLVKALTEVSCHGDSGVLNWLCSISHGTLCEVRRGSKWGDLW